MACRDLTTFEKWIKRATGARGSTYTMIMEVPQLEHGRSLARWQGITGTPITVEHFNVVWKDLCRSIRSTAGREAHLELLLDWYRYPNKLDRIIPGTSPLCWRECAVRGDPRHILWDCPLVQPFWKTIAEALKEILGYLVPYNIATLLLGICPPEFRYQSLWT